MDPINPVQEVKRSPVPLVAGVAVLVVAVVAAGYFYTSVYQPAKKTDDVRQPIKIVLPRFDFEPKAEDGNLLLSLQAFPSDTERSSGLYTYGLASKKLTPILASTGDELIRSGATSPDGRVAVVAKKGGKDELRIYSKTMSMIQANIVPKDLQGKDVRSPAWSPDGSLLSYSVRSRGAEAGPAVPIPSDWDTVVVSLSDKSVAKEVFKVVGKSAVFLDSKKVVLMRNDGIHLVDTAAKTEKRLVRADVRKGLMQFDVSDETSSIVWTYLAGPVLRVATIAPEKEESIENVRSLTIMAHSPRFSPDGRYISATITTEGGVILRAADLRASYITIGLAKFKVGTDIISQWISM